jgi:hypothetical protein
MHDHGAAAQRKEPLMREHADAKAALEAAIAELVASRSKAVPK